MSDVSSDSSFDLIVDDDDDDEEEEEEEEPIRKTRRSNYTKISQYGNYLRHAKKPIFSAELPFEELVSLPRISLYFCRFQNYVYFRIVH